MLQTLVRGERVLGPVTSVTELAHVERVGLFVLVLEVSLERVVAGEGAPTIGTLLGLVDAAGCGGRHTHRRRACKTHPHFGGRREADFFLF